MYFYAYAGWILVHSLILSISTKLISRDSDSDPKVAQLSSISFNFLKSYHHSGGDQGILDAMMVATDKTQLYNI
jgi:hypothetical protein